MTFALTSWIPVLAVAAPVWLGAAALRPHLLPVRRRWHQHHLSPRRQIPPRQFQRRHAATRIRLVVEQGWWSARRRRPPDDQELAAWCDDLARRLRSGSSLAAAICNSVPAPAVRAEVAPFTLALQRGESVAGALEHRVPGARSGSLPTVLGVLRACAAMGGPSAAAIDRAAATLRRRCADAEERRAHSAQARLSALVLTLLPGGVLAITAATSDATRSVVTTPAGLVCLAAGGTLNLIGWSWMGRIVRSEP